MLLHALCEYNKGGHHMTNCRESLRLSSLGLNKTQIAQSVGCSRTTVIKVLDIAEEKRISYPLPSDLSDRKLSELLFPSTKAKPQYKMDFKKEQSFKETDQESEIRRIRRKCRRY